MVLGKLLVLGHATSLEIVGQRPTTLAVGAGRWGGGVVWAFFLSSIIFHFFLPL